MTQSGESKNITLLIFKKVCVCVCGMGGGGGG